MLLVTFVTFVTFATKKTEIMEPTKIYLEDGQPREKVGTARGTATYYKNGDIDFKAYAQGEPQQLDVVKKGQSSCYRTTGKEPKRVVRLVIRHLHSRRYSTHQDDMEEMNV